MEKKFIGGLNAPIVKLLSFALFDEGLRDTEDYSFVDVCARDTNLLYTLTFETWYAKYIGVSLDELSFLDSTSTNLSTGEVTPIWGGSLPKNHMSLTLDVFANGLESLFSKLDATEKDKFVFYCRPPANKSMNKFVGDITSAKQMLGGIFDEYYIRIDNPLEPEWYYLFLLARFIKKNGGYAVVHVPARLLSFARAAAQRQALLEFGVLGQVILLPESLSYGKEDALFVLSRDSEHTKLVDMSKSEPLYQISEVTNAYKEAKEGTTNLDKSLAAKLNWNLSPSFAKLASIVCATTFPLEHLARVARGLSHKKFNEIPAGTDILLHYASAQSLEMGEVLDTNLMKGRVSSQNKRFVKSGWWVEDDKLPLLNRTQIILNRVVTRKNDPFLTGLFLYDMNWFFEKGPYAGANQATQNEQDYPEIDETVYDYDGPQSLESFDAGNLIWLAESSFSISSANLEDSLYLFAFLVSSQGQELLKQTANGNSLLQLSPRDLKKMPIPYPSEKKRQQIVDEFMKIQAEYREAKKQLVQLDVQRRSVFGNAVNEAN